MNYFTYQLHSDLFRPARFMAAAWASMLTPFGMPGLGVRSIGAVCELLARAGLRHERPAFGIDSVEVRGSEVAVHEQVVEATPFATLLHFKKDIAIDQPRVLLVAPLSGHFATLLRNTVSTMLPEHDVYVTDWHNARDVKLSHGRFGLDESVDHVIDFLEAMGEENHVVAVCQASVPALAAAALMAQADNPARPRTMTLMAGPIDSRINPTKVNELATSRSLHWFERNMTTRVPMRYAGAMRRVYPGFLQLAAFMSMNSERHVKAHFELYSHLRKRNHEKANAVKAFYDEYLSVLDLTAEFYLETVKRIFQEHALARGTFTWRGHRVEPSAIDAGTVLTVEGEKDDICSVGQTMAALDLCDGLPAYKKHHYTQVGAGHYGVFSGKRWQNQIYPIIRNIIRASR